MIRFFKSALSLFNNLNKKFYDFLLAIIIIGNNNNNNNNKKLIFIIFSLKNILKILYGLKINSDFKDINLIKIQ